ncbi:MAG: acylphosphatase [Methylobacter sp.]|nr:MAG: acylphosphatase [Methylobacter sp.]PPD18770.1 MAG: acylphosphatase [Methylobacter sp.]
MRTLKLLISGRVQGVFFRASTQKLALQLGVTGTVRNLDDSRVEVIAQAEEEVLQALIDWCHQGPPSAKVERVELIELNFGENFDDFNVV